jgi:peptidyl-prolyl cis-trans isomerase A (cyclophilin A)
MVQVRRKVNVRSTKYLPLLLVLIATVFLLLFIYPLEGTEVADARKSQVQSEENTAKQDKNIAGHNCSYCSYKSMSDLKSYEKFPRTEKELDGNGRRHMVNPPADGKITLVCCETTVGPLSVAVHQNWAPLGAGRFLDMVKDEYFSSKVAMMRCVKNFICQFGIAGKPSLNKKYKSFKDDINWMPSGPKHMTNEFGAKRFARGYFAYAGGGKNSRSNQLIVALGDNKRLGGGSPWEVPFGEVVGDESYKTLAAISTAYGEKGPSQAKLRKLGSTEEIATEFPELDYMTSCVVVDEENL